MPKILSITTHMGGGVGKALAGIAAFNQNHNTGYSYKILMLEKPQKLQFVDQCKADGVEIVCEFDIEAIEEQIKQCDIVLLNWWHHPIMAEFLHKFPQIKMRLVIWSHVSGCNYPMLPFELLQKSHKAFFATRYTYDNPYWNEEQQRYARENAVTVYGMGDMNSEQFPPRVHDGFRVGYVGTLNYSKLNPDFADFAAAANIQDIKFIMVGDTSNRKAITDDAAKVGVEEKIEFRGYTNNVAEELSGFDVFGYLLNPWHFGATENALLEAMAQGLPVVTLNQCAEKYIVTHMDTGLLANDVNDYARQIKYLFDRPDERARLGANARKYILDEFSMNKNVDRMNKAFDDVMQMSPDTFTFDDIFGTEPYQWFLTCLGADKKQFESSIDPVTMSNSENAAKIEDEIKKCRPILKENSKSSILHFARHFSADRNLAYWQELQEFHKRTGEIKSDF